MSAATHFTNGFAPRETESHNKPNLQQTLVARNLGALRIIPPQTPEEKLAQFAERAQLGIWLADAASSTEAVALAQNIYESARDGARISWAPFGC
jgi:hypothetical protein